MQAMLALNNRFHAGYKYSKGHDTCTNDCVVIEIPLENNPLGPEIKCVLYN